MVVASNGKSPPRGDRNGCEFMLTLGGVGLNAHGVVE